MKNFLLLLLILSPLPALADSTQLYCVGNLSIGKNDLGEAKFTIVLDVEKKLYGIMLDRTELASGTFEITPNLYRKLEIKEKRVRELFEVNRMSLEYSFGFVNKENTYTNSSGHCEIYKPKI